MMVLWEEKVLQMVLILTTRPDTDHYVFLPYVVHIHDMQVH